MVGASGSLVLWMTFAFAVLVVVLVLAASAARAWRQRQDRRRREAEKVARPLILAALDGDLPDTSVELSAEVSHYLDTMASAMAGKLRGADRAALADLLARRGSVLAARARTRSVFAIRRLRAVELLGSLGVADASGDLVSRLDDPDAEVRRAAVRAIGRTASDSAVPALLALLDAPDRKESTHYITLALLRIGPTAAPHLAGAVLTQGPRGREAAAQVLGWLGEPTGVSALERALGDPVTPVRIAAVDALGRIGLPTSAAAMRRLLAPTEPQEVRIAAATALGRLGDPGSVDVLAQLLGEAHVVSRAAANALAQLGPRGLDALSARSGVPEAEEILAARGLLRAGHVPHPITAQEVRA